MMKSSIVMAVLLPIGMLSAQTRPLVDHHQHLFRPATVRLVAPRPAPVRIPAELDSLLQARARGWQDATALRQLYTDDVALLHHARPGWIRGRDSVVAFWVRSAPRSASLIPAASSIDDRFASINAYLTEGEGDASHTVAYVLLTLRKDSRNRWRVASEAVTSVNASVEPIVGKDLVALLDAAGIQRALVLSMAYTWGSPNRNVENEYEKVKAENDWTSQEVAKYPDRLRAFCSLNPLRDYALDELARCSRDAQLRRGLKLHLANSVVNYHNPQHVEQMRRVFRAANDYRMPILVHMRSSISQRLPYGREEAQIFFDSIVPSAPDVTIQIAHLAGAGGYDDTIDDALAVFADAAQRGDPRIKRMYFEVSGVMGLRLGAFMDKADTIAKRIRQLGVERVLFGSDAATGGNLGPREAWIAFRQLPLTDAEFQTIANNVAPYMR